MKGVSVLGLKAVVARDLFDLGAIKFGAFRLKLHEKNPDAPLSPIYLNLRTARHPVNPGPLTEVLMMQIGVLMSWALEARKTSFECIAGIPDAGEPFADELVIQYRKEDPSRLRLRKESLTDGTRRIASEVAGEFAPGNHVVLVDDLITQADSKIEAIRALEYQGLEVATVLVLVDRQQGGKEQLQQTGHELSSVFTLDELLSFYADNRLVDEVKADEVRSYVAANRV